MSAIRILLATVALGVSQMALPHASAQRRPAMQVMTLTSTAFPDGGTIPARHAQMGRDRSPALSWSGAPDSTRSFVLLVHDADAAIGDGTDDVAPAPGHQVPGRAVEETVPRHGLFRVQTPQLFEIELLKRAYAQPDLDGATDDAMLVERLGEKVTMVEGDERNLKITTQSDLAIARAIAGVKGDGGKPAHLRF